VKALCVREPWASAIASGRKTIETRTWTTWYRGPLLIVGTRMEARGQLGRTRAIARCELVEIRPMKGVDEVAAQCPIYRGAYAWVLEGVVPIAEFNVCGRLGLFDVELSEEGGKR